MPSESRAPEGTGSRARDRRWSERVPVSSAVRLRADGQDWEGLGRDLSLEGIFVALEHLPPPHLSRFEATVTGSEGGVPVPAVLEVAHRRPEGLGLRLCLAGGTDFPAWRDLWRRSGSDEAPVPAAGAGSR